jgi:hypothetical protein
LLQPGVSRGMVSGALTDSLLLPGRERSCGLAFCASSSVPSQVTRNRISAVWSIRSTKPLHALRAFATPLSLSARRRHAGASETAIEMSTRIWCAAEPIMPSGTSMSLTPDGSPLMTPREHFGNRVASGFFVVPVIYSSWIKLGSAGRSNRGAAVRCRIAFQPYIMIMPQHDLPDGQESESNVIDFSKRLRQRAQASAPNTDHAVPDESYRDAYRHAEYSDGRRPAFGRYDVLWLALIASLGLMLWYLILR